MKGRHFSEVKRISKKSKSIILSVIAIIELILLMTSMTFAWFEGLTSLEMKGENIPTADVLNSHIEVGENSSDNDTTYDSIIDLTEFYDAQKEVRLSPVSSADAEHFYAAYSGEPGATGTKYRELSEEDINSNIIRFEFTISSPDGPFDLYLSEIVPRIVINNTAYSNRYSYPYRYAFSDGTDTHILSTNNVLNTNSADCFVNQKAISSLNSDDTANTVAGTVERTRRYSYYANHAASIAGPGAGGSVAGGTILEPLFRFEKGETKTITVSIWLEALDYECLNSTAYKPVSGKNISFFLKLATTWSIYREITVYDYTADQWIDKADENHSDAAMKFGVRNLDSSGDKRFYEFTYNSTNKTWKGNIPLALQNCEFVWMTEDGTDEYASWEANGRGTNTEITMFGSDDYVWGIGSDDVVRIALSDNTENKWLNNDNPKMRIQINYEGASLDYSMTDSPAVVDGLNTWYAYIPSSVDAVVFNRCDRTDNTKVYNYWNAPNRDNETVYYALESGVLEEIEGTAIYLNVPAAYASQFFYQDRIPAISLTSDDNVAVINNLGDNRESLGKSNYYMGAHGDTWIGTGQMTKVNDPNLPNANIYVFYFDYELPDGEYLTFWNRSQSNNHNNVDNNVSFAPAIQYNSSKGNMLTIGYPEQLTDSQFSGCYIFDEYQWDSYDGGGQGNTTTQPEQQSGQWGAPDEMPAGTYGTRFVHTSSVTSVTATFDFYGVSHTVTLTKESGNTWITREIPDAVTTITFKDSSGRTWSNTTGRTSTDKYYIVTGNSTGYWGVPKVTLYLKPNTNWKSDSARFAAYFFDDSVSPTVETWVSMTDSDGDGIYECTVPDGNWPEVIFCRMNPSSSTNNWDNKWNQTSDLTVPTDGTNMYTVASGTWDKGGGTWSTK